MRNLSIILALTLTACAQMKVHANERTFNLPAAKDTPASDPTCGWIAVKASGKEDTLHYCCAGGDGSKPRCREAMWN
jgi:hypothetical protein